MPTDSLPFSLGKGLFSHFGLSDVTNIRLVITAAVLLGMVLVRWLVGNAVRRRISDPRERYRWNKGTTYATVALALLVLARVWLVDLGGLATYLGLLSAGLAIAFKDPLTNLAAWLFILLRRPFEVGDRIAIAEHSGDVVDVRLFQFTLLEIGHWVAADQSTGRLIHLPNALLFTVPLANFTRGFHTIWTELPVLVTFESNWQRARSALQALAQQHGAEAAQVAGTEMLAVAGRYALPSSATDPAVYVTVEDSGVLLTVRLPCDPRRRREVTDTVWREILELFAGFEDVDFAYPTTRYYLHPSEGKPAMRPPADG